jgi:hypothetical protein
MNPPTTATLTVRGTTIAVTSINNDSYISLTDMSKGVEGEFTVKNWLRGRTTIEFLGIWEKLNNSNFNLVEFDLIKKQAGLNTFNLSTKQWAEQTNAIGLVAKAGRYGVKEERFRKLEEHAQRQLRILRQHSTQRLPPESSC